MAEIKAIETIYNGYRFRSRLEARWAVFFDSAGIEYQYEPEGFELIDGSRYLPDFFLPRIGYYVEVKGFATKDDEKKIRLFSNYCGEYGDYEGKPIIVFGQIPKGWYEITDIAYNPITKDIDVYPFNYEYSRWDHYAALFYKDPCGEIGFSGYDWVKKEDHFPLCFEWVDRHFDKARQARFEHGEKG